MRKQIKDIVLAAIKEYGEEKDQKIDLTHDEKTRLYGTALDSIDLVSVVVSIEEAVEDAFDKSVTLTDEKAMSRRVSPFASVGTLIDYIEELLNSNE